MSEKLKLAIIGLDTSHAVEFPKLIQDPATPPERRIEGLQVTRCLRFSTPFQSEEGLNQRQAYLESIGVEVTTDFDYAVGDCDVISININDPAFHLEYFEKCAKLGKRIFLDKPVADNLENTVKIFEIAKENNVEFCSASSLRFDVDFLEGCERNPNVSSLHVWGPVGCAAAGSSIIWYGVHAFEMLQRGMGRGAATVTVSTDRNGYLCHVIYKDGRRGIVELTRNNYEYGAVFRNNSGFADKIDVTRRIPYYRQQLLAVLEFFKTGKEPNTLEDTFEVMAMLDAADRSAVTGRPEVVYTK